MLSKIASVKLNSTSLFFIVSGLLKDWGDEPEIVSENDEKIKKSNQIHYWTSPEISQQINHFLLNLNQKPIFPSKRKLEANWKERERERERERGREGRRPLITSLFFCYKISSNAIFAVGIRRTRMLTLSRINTTLVSCPRRWTWTLLREWAERLHSLLN